MILIIEPVMQNVGFNKFKTKYPHYHFGFRDYSLQFQKNIRLYSFFACFQSDSLGASLRVGRQGHLGQGLKQPHIHTMFSSSGKRPNFCRLVLHSGISTPIPFRELTMQIYHVQILPQMIGLRRFVKIVSRCNN